MEVFEQLVRCDKVARMASSIMPMIVTVSSAFLFPSSPQCLQSIVFLQTMCLPTTTSICFVFIIQHIGEIPSSPDDGYGNRSAGSHEDQRADQRAFDDTNSEPPAAAEPPDLLDFSEPAVPPAPALSHQTSFQSQPAYSTQAFPVQQQQQQNYPSPGTPQSQPPQYGAPPQHQPQFAGAPPGQYPVQQQQNFGPPPPMQQQYGQPQSYGGY